MCMHGTQGSGKVVTVPAAQSWGWGRAAQGFSKCCQKVVRVHNTFLPSSALCMMSLEETAERSKPLTKGKHCHPHWYVIPKADEFRIRT